MFSLIIQEEKQRRVGTNPVVEFAALLSRGSNASNKGNSYSNKFNGKKERPIGSHCGIIGHVMDKCYKIHGYLPGSKAKERIMQLIW